MVNGAVLSIRFFSPQGLSPKSTWFTANHFSFSSVFLRLNPRLPNQIYWKIHAQLNLRKHKTAFSSVLEYEQISNNFFLDKILSTLRHLFYILRVRNPELINLIYNVDDSYSRYDTASSYGISRSSDERFHYNFASFSHHPIFSRKHCRRSRRMEKSFFPSSKSAFLPRPSPISSAILFLILPSSFFLYFF